MAIFNGEYRNEAIEIMAIGVETIGMKLLK